MKKPLMIVVALAFVLLVVAIPTMDTQATRPYPGTQRGYWMPTDFRYVHWPEMPLETETCAPEQKPIDHPWHYPSVYCWTWVWVESTPPDNPWRRS